MYKSVPARGWVLAEQTCIARGSPVQTKLACVEVPFPLRVLQDDGALRARHGVLLFAGEDSPQCPARAPRPLVPASPSASQPPVLKLRGLATSLPYRAASNIHGASIFAKPPFSCGLRNELLSTGCNTSSRSGICRSSALLSVASISCLPGSILWKGRAALLLRRFRVTGRTCRLPNCGHPFPCENPNLLSPLSPTRLAPPPSRCSAPRTSPSTKCGFGRPPLGALAAASRAVGGGQSPGGVPVDIEFAVARPDCASLSSGPLRTSFG